MSSDNTPQPRPCLEDEMEGEAAPQNYWNNPKPEGIALFAEPCETTDYQYQGWLIREDEKKVVLAGRAEFDPVCPVEGPIQRPRRPWKETRYGIWQIGVRLIERYGDNNVLLCPGRRSIAIYIDAEAYKKGAKNNSEHPNVERLRPGRHHHNDLRQSDFWVDGPAPEPSIGDMPFYGLDPTPKAFTLFIHQTSVISASYQAVLIREDEETVVLAGEADNPRFRYPGMLERLLEAKYGQNFAVKTGDGIVTIYINADTFYNRPKRNSCYANKLGIFGHAREHECDASAGEKLLQEYTSDQEKASRRHRAVDGWTEAQAPSACSLSNGSPVPENVTAPFVLRPAKDLVVRANMSGGDPWKVWSRVKKELKERWGSKNVLPCEQSGYLFIYIDRGDFDNESVDNSISIDEVREQRERLRPSPFEQRMYMRALVRAVVRHEDMWDLHARYRKLRTRGPPGDL